MSSNVLIYSLGQQNTKLMSLESRDQLQNEKCREKKESPGVRAGCMDDPCWGSGLRGLTEIPRVPESISELWSTLETQGATTFLFRQ